MIKNAAKLFVITIVFASCKQQHDSADIKMLIQGFENANEHVALSNFHLYRQFEQDAAEPANATFSLNWFPKSKKIKEYTAEMIRDIDLQLDKNALQIESEHHDLYNQLLNYKRSLINVLDPVEQNASPALRQQVIKDMSRLYAEIPVLAFGNDIMDSSSARSKEKRRFDSLFYNPNSLMQKAVLNKIKNDVLLSENKLLYYCLSRVSGPHIHYEEFGIVAALNSSYFKAGDTVELLAGIARYGGDSSPRITVNGKEIETKGYGRTNHFFQAKGKPGKYSLKVKFVYVKADGTKESATKNLNYTILP